MNPERDKEEDILVEQDVTEIQTPWRDKELDIAEEETLPVAEEWEEARIEAELADLIVAAEDPLRFYFHEIGKVSLLTAEDEKRLKALRLKMRKRLG